MILLLRTRNITAPSLSLSRPTPPHRGQLEITAKMHGKVFQLDIKPKKSGRKDGRFPTFRGGPQLSFEKQKREHGKETKKKRYHHHT